MKNILLISISLVSALGLTACDSPVVGSALNSGHYEGNVIQSTNGILKKTPVETEISAVSGSSLVLNLENIDKTKYSDVSLAGYNSDSPTLSIPGVPGSPFQLQKSDGCFTVKNNLAVSLCYTSTEIQIDVRTNKDVPVYSLTLDAFTGQSPVKLEDPKVYTLDEAVNLSFSKDFQNRMEFERVMQARHQASNAYMNLLPHLSINSILAVVTPSVSSILSVAGDLVPFLLPNRWFQAAEVGQIAKAQSYALTVMRGNTAEQMESFAYTMNRDERITGLYQQTIADSQKLRDIVASLESIGRLPPGSSDIVQTSIANLVDDQESLDQMAHTQKSFAAQSLGLLNPEGVLAINITSEALPIDSAVALDPKPLMEIAVTRSFELSQIDDLIAAGKDAKTAVYFNWLDPSGDPTANLGFGLGDSVAIEASKISELQTQRQQVQAIVLQDVSNTISEYNTNLEAYARANANLAMQNARVARVQDQINLDTKVTQLDLANAYSDRLRAQVNIEQAITDFRVNRAKLDRLLLQGYYSHLTLTGMIGK